VSDFIDFTVSDAELEIKKRARRRLMGASVLALLAAIALPLALKNSDEPRAVPDMQVSIPEGGEFELPQPVAENDSADSEFAEAVIEPDAAPGVPESPIDNVTPSSPEPSPPARASVPPEQPAPSQPAARLPEEPRQKSPPPRQSAAEKEAERAREAEAARALALLDGKPPAKEAGKETTTQGQTFIQVSAFSNADRAARQVKELNDQGFAAYTEKAGKVTRVRIGPLPRSEGEQVLARLKAQGHKPVLSSR
jgi:DedD protein